MSVTLAKGIAGAPPICIGLGGMVHLERAFSFGHNTVRATHTGCNSHPNFITMYRNLNIIKHRIKKTTFLSQYYLVFMPLYIHDVISVPSQLITA